MNQSICRIHGLNVLYRNEKDPSKSYCDECLKETFHFVSEAEFQSKSNKSLENIISFIHYLGETVCEDLQQFSKKLTKISQEVEQFVISYKKEINNQYLIFEKQQGVELNQLKGLFKSFKTEIQFLLQNNVIKEQISDLNMFFMNLEDKQNNLFQLVQKEESLNSEIRKQSQIQVTANKIQQWAIQDYCKALSVNNAGNTLAVGREKTIIICSLQQGMFKEQQQLQGHTSRILCLEFMKNQNKLISGEGKQQQILKSQNKQIQGDGKQESSIIIWIKNENQQWQQEEVFSPHKDAIFTLVCNKNENIIISGSQDKTINVQIKGLNKWESQQVIDFTAPVLSLSLNEAESKLVTSLKENAIFVLELDAQKQWFKSQRIEVSQMGSRIGFINDTEFAFQAKDLEVYEFNKQTSNFQKTTATNLPPNNLPANEKNDEWLFPIKFIKHHQLLVHKNGKYVHFLQRLNGQYKLLQTLDFTSQYLYGTLTQNGEYLITWNFSSKNIQVWQIKIQ